MSEAWKITELKGHKKWKLFHATDFVSLMYPCFFIASIFGIFPFKCASSRYTFSRIRFVYSMITVATFLTMFLFLEYELNFDALVFDTLPKTMHQQFYLIVTGIIVLITYSQRKSKQRLLEDLSEVSSMLSPKDFNDMAIFVHSKDIFLFLFLSSHVFNCTRSDSYMTVRNFTNLFMMSVNFVADMFYMNCACILKACFAKINEELDEFKRPVNQKFLCHGQRTASLLMKLKNLERKHLQVTDILQFLNEMFITRIVVTAVTTFTIVTFNIYFFLIWFNGGEQSWGHKHFWYAPYICSALYHFLKFVLMIWACETATDKAERIRITLHDVLSEASDLTVKRELELFSLQLLHRETTFSAKLIVMNASFLAELVGGIAMYLLVLIQFLLNTIICRLMEN